MFLFKRPEGEFAFLVSANRVNVGRFGNRLTQSA